VTVSFWGFSVRFLANSPDLLADMRGLLPAARPTNSRPEITFQLNALTSGGECIYMFKCGRKMLISGKDRILVLDAFASHLERTIAENVSRYVFVHAGAVASKNRMILIPGPSGSGKSSLVRALVEAGGVYYSDEYAVLDHDGSVHPFPRALSLRRPDGQKRKVPMDDSRNYPPLPVGLVIVSRYQAGSQWDPEPLSPGQAVLALLANTVRARLDPERTIGTLRAAVGNCRAFETVRPEAEAVADELLLLMTRVVGERTEEA